MSRLDTCGEDRQVLQVRRVLQVRQDWSSTPEPEDSTWQWDSMALQTCTAAGAEG